jgi:hypothetical protein
MEDRLPGWAITKPLTGAENPGTARIRPAFQDDCSLSMDLMDRPGMFGEDSNAV